MGGGRARVRAEDARRGRGLGAAVEGRPDGDGGGGAGRAWGRRREQARRVKKNRVLRPPKTTESGLAKSENFMLPIK